MSRWPYRTPDDRFEKWVSRDGSGCWLWTGQISHLGYARWWQSHLHRTEVVHRWAYERYVGPIPDGMELDHLCRNRRCVNPEHLEPVTHKENTLRGTSPAALNAKKTHCIRGHEFSKHAVIRPQQQGKKGTRRICRLCEQIRNHNKTRKASTT